MSRKRRLRSTALAAAIVAQAGITNAIAAQGPDAVPPAEDLAEIKAEIAEMRREYDAKIEDLQARLDQAEAAAVAVAPLARDRAGPVVAAAPPQPAFAPSTPTVSQNASNPGIAVVLNGQFGAFENDPDAALIPGFPLSEEAGLQSEGFSLGESEIALSANIDHRVFGNLIFALTDEGEVEVEEAYIQSTSLPGGFILKAGRFFSSIGYLNDKHSHNWDLIDAPLPYRAFLGAQYGDAGIQGRWIAPTDFYLEAGAEWFRGDSFPAGGSSSHGRGAVAGFVQSGGDIGVASSWLAKVSYLRTKSDGRETEGGGLFNGIDNLGVVSLVYKWAPHGNAKVRNLILSGEYFLGDEKGEFNGVPINLDRSGWYAQGVYQFRPNWRIGARYAQISSEDAPALLAGSEIDNFGRSPRATSAMLEFDTSEFSRFRLMYTYDDSDFASNNEFLARYTVIFGKHGAHRF